MQKNTSYLYIVVFLIGTIGIFSQSCDQFQLSAPCGGENPAEELDWLKEMISESDTFQQKWATVGRFEFGGKDYFIFGYCHPAITYIPTYRNCQGDSVDLAAVDPNIHQIFHGSSNPNWVWCGSSCSCDE